MAFRRRKKRRVSRKRKTSSSVDHALKFAMQGNPVKFELYTPERSESYGTMDLGLGRPLTHEEKEFQMMLTASRRRR